ncbi:hypothetical protein B0T21DRAFT_175911 [Apiosordaria backusii]|uniref:Uncharacterized protein n=1 Tax=Apiosordaria backusii TaxID=314023 RepID=A0AA40EDQ9_9PEZI|nr:hypothetical protein B0T21DRAFT_175911 [Apiosordaria backusii]
MKLTAMTTTFLSLLAFDTFQGTVASPTTGGSMAKVKARGAISSTVNLNTKRQDDGVNYGVPTCNRVIFLLNIPCLGLWGGFCDAAGFQTTVLEEVTKPVCDVFCDCPAPVPAPAPAPA